MSINNIKHNVGNVCTELKSTGNDIIVLAFI